MTMYCTACGTQLLEGSRFCSQCGQGIHSTPVPVSQLENELRLVLPVGTPLLAILAGYLGLFSVLVLPAPFAVIVGLLGLRKLKGNPELHGTGRCWTGIVLGLIFSVFGGFLLFGSLL